MLGLEYCTYASHAITRDRMPSFRLVNRPSEHLRRTSFFDTAVADWSERSQRTGDKILPGPPNIPIATVENEGGDTWHSGYGTLNPGVGSGVPRESSSQRDASQS